MHRLFTTMSCLILVAVAAPAAMAANSGNVCNLSDLTCSEKGKKCNIHFKNRTGTASNSKCLSYKSRAEAKAVKVTARDPDGERIGNALTIQSTENNTMNVSKKAAKGDLSSIRVTVIGESNNWTENVKLSCDQIRTILASGDNSCIVRFSFEDFIRTKNSKPFLSLACAKDMVCSPYDFKSRATAP